MYVAQRQISIRKPDGSVAEIAPGEEVEGFADWPLWQRNVHLQEEIVVNSQGPLLADRLVTPVAPAARPSLTHAPKKSQAEELKDAISSQPVVQPDDASKVDAEGGDSLMCEHCEKGPFKSEHGLKLHVGKAHA